MESGGVPMQIPYPAYDIELPDDLIQQCVDLAPRLLHEVGLSVPNDRFLSALKGKAGIRIDNQRIYFEPDLTREYINEFIAKEKARAKAAKPAPDPPSEWTVTTAGFSMMTIDVETEELREGTCQDLRNMIKLADSFGIGGSYMIMPQELPPLMRTIACFKICWEMSDKIRPYDYQQREQIPSLYAMHRVVDKPMSLDLVIPSAMTVDQHYLDIVLDMHPVWKDHPDHFRFGVLNYPMLGILKPITAPGCAAMCFCESLAVHIAFRLFDPDFHLPIQLNSGIPTDMRSTCWAFGSPRRHLFRFLQDQLVPNLVGVRKDRYAASSVLLETSSPAVDELAGMEKMASGLIGALQGARTFGYAGVLCVDDVYSGTQFVIDLEIVNYIRELIESFDPHPDVIDAGGLYDELLDVCQGNDMFLSHPNTVKRFRNVLPSSDLIVREKLRSWMSHHKTLKDRAREMALDRIRSYEPTFHLPDDQQKELDRIYADAEKKLS